MNLYDSMSVASELGGNKADAIMYCLKGLQQLEEQKAKTGKMNEGQKKYIEGRLAKLRG